MTTSAKTTTGNKTRKARVSTVVKGETKAQKFARLGQQRVTKTVKAMRNIAKLGGYGYERNAEQVEKIVNLLKAEVAAIETALQPKAKVEKGEAETIITL